MTNLNLDTVNIVILIMAVVNTIYGLVVYSRNRADKTNLSFFILTLAVSFWDISMFAYRAFSDHNLTVLSARILYLAASTIPISFLYFVFIFPDSKFKATEWQKYLLPIPFIVSCVVSVLPNYLIQDVLFISGRENIIVFSKWLHAYYAVYIISYFSWGYLLLFKKYLRSSGILKTQVVFILTGTLISTAIGVFTNLILLFFFNIFAFNWLGQIGTIAMISLISYAILKHHLFNIRVIMAELYTFSLWFFILMRVLSTDNSQEKILNSILLVSVIVFGIFLIMSVRKEVAERERSEKLAADLKESNTKISETNKKLEEANKALEVANTKLSETNKKLEESNIAIEETMGFITHQIRRVFTNAKAGLSALVEGDYGPMNDGMASMVKQMYDSQVEGVDNTEKFLKLSRIDHDSNIYEKKLFDFGDLVREVAEENRKRATDKRLAYEVTVSDSNYGVLGDRTYIKEAISNLIDNSIRYTPAGSIFVNLSKAGDKIVFSVKDSGIGITEEDKKKLFKKYGHGKDSRKINTECNGLGLYAVKKILDKHGWKILVESEGNGKGSTFTVELPIRQE